MADQNLRFRADLKDNFSGPAKRIEKSQHNLSGRFKDSTAKVRSNRAAYIELSRAIGDARFGVIGITNNLQRISELLGLNAGLVVGISLLTTLLPEIIEYFKSLGEQGKQAAEAVSEEFASNQGAVAAVQIYAEVLRTATEGTDAHTYALKQLKEQGYDPAKHSLDQFIKLQEKQILLNAAEKALTEKLAKPLGKLVKRKLELAEINKRLENDQRSTGSIARGADLGRRIALRDRIIPNLEAELKEIKGISSDLIKDIFGEGGLLEFITSGERDPLASWRKRLQKILDANEDFGKDAFELLKTQYERSKKLVHKEVDDEKLKNQLLVALRQEYINKLTELSAKQLDELKKHVKNREKLSEKEAEKLKKRAERLSNSLSKIQRKYAELGYVDTANKLKEALDELDANLASGKISIFEYIAALEKLKEAFENIDPGLEAVNKAFQSAVASFTVDLATAIGDAINSNDEDFDFGNAILEAIGSFLVTVGSALITYGVLMGGFILLSSNPLSWPVAIAIGIAAVAAGTVLSNAASKGPFDDGQAPSRSATTSTTTTPTSVQGFGPDGMGLVATVRGQDLRFVLQAADDSYEGYN